MGAGDAIGIVSRVYDGDLRCDNTRAGDAVHLVTRVYDGFL